MSNELESVVKLDFSKAASDSAAIARNFRDAGRSQEKAFSGGGSGGHGQGQFTIQRGNIWIRDARIQITNATVSGIKSGGFMPARDPKPGRGKDDKDNGYSALLGTAAASSAFVWKAASLANPGAMSRFNDAVEDTTAVIGHELIPALNEFTRIIRGVGDWMANHPTTTKAIAYGGLGLAGVASLGALLATAKMAYGGLAWGARGVGSAASYAGNNFSWGRYAAGQFGFGGGGGGASGAATSGAGSASAAARGGARVFQTGYTVNGFPALSGGAGSGAMVPYTGNQALSPATEALARSRPYQTGYTTNAAGAGGAARAGARGFGSLLGRLALPIAVVTGSAELAAENSASGAMDALGRIGMISPILNKALTGKLQGGLGDAWNKNISDTSKMDKEWNWFSRYVIQTPISRGLENNGVQINPFKWRISDTPEEKKAKEEDAKKTSWNAAARQTQYTDVLSSVLSMRQSISSAAGNDPNERTANATERAANALEQMSGTGSGGGLSWESIIQSMREGNPRRG